MLNSFVTICKQKCRLSRIPYGHCRIQYTWMSQMKAITKLGCWRRDVKPYGGHAFEEVGSRLSTKRLLQQFCLHKGLVISRLQLWGSSNSCWSSLWGSSTYSTVAWLTLMMSLGLICERWQSKNANHWSWYISSHAENKSWFAVSMHWAMSAIWHPYYVHCWGLEDYWVGP